jgi:predicted transcriptional regulator of viral defense system
MQMGYRPTKTAHRKLSALAQNQAGYFTAKQAAEFGYKYPHLDYHVQSGNFERVGHGLYRLPGIPPSDHDDLVRLSFWSRDRNDNPQAVVSHQTALAIHDLSDLLPSKIHLTVPTTFRKKSGREVVLHRVMVDPSAVEEREGFSVTTPLRTLMDIAADPKIADEHLKRATAEALKRGLVRKPKLLAAAKKSPDTTRLSRMITAMR